MIGSEHRMTTTDNRSRAVMARDAALDRVRRTRRWVIIATAALTAGFAALVSAVAPGRSLASKSATGTEVASSSSQSANGASSGSSVVPQLPPAANPDSLGLQGGGQAPQSAPSPSQNSAPSQSTPPQTSTPAQPSPPASAPQPAAPQSSGGGGVVSGGS